jgi:hypothetical protein
MGLVSSRVEHVLQCFSSRPSAVHVATLIVVHSVISCALGGIVCVSSCVEHVLQCLSLRPSAVQVSTLIVVHSVISCASKGNDLVSFTSPQLHLYSASPWLVHVEDFVSIHSYECTCSSSSAPTIPATPSNRQHTNRATNAFRFLNMFGSPFILTATPAQFLIFINRFSII